MQQTHREHQRVRKPCARLAQLRKGSAVADQVGKLRNIRRQKAAGCGRVRNQVAEIIRPDAGLSQCGLQRPRCKLSVGIACTRTLMSECKVSADMPSAYSEPGSESHSLPSDIYLKARVPALEPLSGHDCRTRQSSSHSQQAHRARIPPRL